LFILLTHGMGETVALRYALLVIAAVQFFSVALIRSIQADSAWREPAVDDLGALEKLKKPG
jgi:hypothetical protein